MQFSVGSGHFIVGLGRGHGQYVQMDGPSLQVDLGDYDGKSRTLLSFAKKEGDFGNISVVGANEKDYEAFVRPDRIYLRANIGTVLMVR